TGTNRPSGLASTHLLATRPLCGSRGTGTAAPRPGAVSYLNRVSAVIAKGKHPVPFRTRKLSSSAPMVLRGGPRGRVGRRRTYREEGRSRKVERPSSFVWLVLMLKVGKRV